MSRDLDGSVGYRFIVIIIFNKVISHPVNTAVDIFPSFISLHDGGGGGGRMRERVRAPSKYVSETRLMVEICYDLTS